MDQPRFLRWDRLHLPDKELSAAGTTDSHLMDLAGNSFSGQVVGAVILSVLVHYPLGAITYDLSSETKKWDEEVDSVLFSILG